MKKYLFLLSLLSPLASSAFNLDSVTASYGQGDPAQVRTGLVGAQWAWFSSLYTNKNWKITTLLDTQIGYWSTNSPTPTDQSSIATFSGTPIFQAQTTLPQYNIDPYIDGGIGLAIFSNNKIGGNNLGPNWGFQYKVGAGFKFGTQQQFDLSYHFIRFTNFNLASNNDGFEANWLLTFAYHLS